MNQAVNSENYLPHRASFRDPSGFMFTHEGMLYRQVNMIYRPHYDHLIRSGLYTSLTTKRWLVNHTEVKSPVPNPGQTYKILQPSRIRFISYPHEWSFSQLKDAALLTLDIQEEALEHKMSLKDASAYNIQFERGVPMFIDTLSFECYEEGQPWEAYRQFCRHFLAPLALMAKNDVRLGQLLKVYIDGIPLDLASGLLSKVSWLRPGLLMHLHLHARMEQAFSQTDKPSTARSDRVPRLSKKGLTGILNTLRNTIENLKWKPRGTEWGQYYQATNYSESSFEEKCRLVANYLKLSDADLVWDLGANTGHFSRLAEDIGATTIAFDIDPAAVEINYQMLREKGSAGPLPLLLDLTNPSPGLGWNNRERDSLIDRGPADCVMALALVHHLAISNNLPLDHIANFLAQITRYLIIEFVPKSDSQVQRLLKSRKDIFEAYTREHFEKTFGAHFSIVRVEKIKGTERVLYLMIKNGCKAHSF